MLGIDGLNLLGINADYENYLFTIETDEEVETFKVVFNCPTMSMQWLEPEENISEESQSESDDESERDENETGDEESEEDSSSSSYLIIRCLDEKNFWWKIS